VDDDSGQPHIAYRGTQNRFDVATDIKSFIGVGSKRLAHSQKVAKQVERKYNMPANAVGHSLGGLLAERSGVNGSITTYNKLATGRKMNKNPNQTDYRSKHDLPSFLTLNNKSNVTVKGKSVNPLTVHSTKGLKERNVTI
jgi:hypothetical protein